MPKTLPVIDMSAPVCCAPVAAGPVDDTAALEVALRLKALADPVRVKLMSLLLASPDTGENGGDLAAAVGLSESTVSHHLGQLRKAGLVDSERIGMNVVHRRAPRCAHRIVRGPRPQLLPLTITFGPAACVADRRRYRGGAPDRRLPWYTVFG